VALRGALCTANALHAPLQAQSFEVDVSAGRCTVQRARAVRRVQDADKEEWDVFAEGEVALGSAASVVAGE
jgi:hypothetical protein